MSDHDSTGSAAGKAAVGGGLTLLLFLKMLSGCSAPIRNTIRLGGTVIRSAGAGRGAVAAAAASRAGRGAVAMDLASGVGGAGRAAEEAYVLRGTNAARNALNDLRGVAPANPSGLGQASQEFTAGAAGVGEKGSFVKKGRDLSHASPRFEPAGLARIVQQERLRSQLLLLHAAEETSTKPKVLSIVPTSEDAYRNVFNMPLSGAGKREMIKYSKLFGGLDDSRVVTSAEYDSKALFAYIRENPNNKSLIIVGHSEEANAGRSFLLPNGEKVSVDLIHERCLASGSTCLVLTCHSKDFRLSSQITMKEAYQMTRRGIEIRQLAETRSLQLPRQIRAALADGSLTPTDLMVEAMHSERVVRKASKVTISGAAGVGVVYAAKSTYAARKRRGRP